MANALLLPALMLLIFVAGLCFWSQQFATEHLHFPHLDQVRRDALRAAAALREEPRHERTRSIGRLMPRARTGVPVEMAAGVTPSASLPPRNATHDAPGPLGNAVYLQPHLARSQQTSAGATGSACPGRKPYHVVLTAASGLYQEWQSRIAYYHYRKLKAAHVCSDIGGFTRLLNTPGARPDGLMREMPTVLVKQLGYGR